MSDPDKLPIIVGVGTTGAGVVGWFARHLLGSHEARVRVLEEARAALEKELQSARSAQEKELQELRTRVAVIEALAEQSSRSIHETLARVEATVKAMAERQEKLAIALAKINGLEDTIR
jgi:3-hydroxyacyl-CoA dehydrogenase